MATGFLLAQSGERQEVNLPGVMRALATAQLKPRIIVLTNYDLPEYKNAAIALGATHFLDKARDYGRLPEVLHDIREAHLSKH